MISNIIKCTLLTLLFFNKSWATNVTSLNKNNFNFFSDSIKKPNIFEVNKGVVKVVNSTESFWVRYPDSKTEMIKCSIKGNKLVIDAKKDNIEITINLNKLQDCKIKMDAGVLEVHHVCKHSDVTLLSGTMNVYTNKHKAGKILAKVETGIIYDNSGLIKMESVPQDEYYTLNTILLMGELKDYSAEFTVKSGIFNISDE